MILEKAEHSSFFEDLCDLADLNPKEARQKDLGKITSWINDFYEYPFFNGAARYINDNGGIILSAREHTEYIKNKKMKNISEFIEAALLQGKAEDSKKEASYEAIINNPDYKTPYFYDYIPTTTEEIEAYTQTMTSKMMDAVNEIQKNEDFQSFKNEVLSIREEVRKNYADNNETK